MTKEEALKEMRNAINTLEKYAKQFFPFSLSPEMSDDVAMEEFWDTVCGPLRKTFNYFAKEHKEKKIGDLTLREIVKEHKSRKECNGCPYNSNHLTNDYKTHLCRISCSNTGLDLEQEIEVEDDEI